MKLVPTWTLEENIDHAANMIMVGVRLEIEKALYEVCGAWVFQGLCFEIDGPDRCVIVPSIRTLKLLRP